MASTMNADGKTDIGDLATRLTRMGDRTSLMVIDATLRSLPADDAAQSSLTDAGAAAEVRELARRMLQATHDFRAALHEPAE